MSPGRSSREGELLLTWPAEERAESYRLLLRDCTLEKLVSKVECPRAQHRLDMTGLRADHRYEWAVQTRADRSEDWQHHLPYLRLMRPSDPPSPTEIEWEPMGADIYRVLIKDKLLDVAVVKDALAGTRYAVDWTRLIPGHEHTYVIQALVPGPTVAWETIHPSQPLPAPPPQVVVGESAEPSRQVPDTAPRPLLFFFTCDTEVNMRRMKDPVPARGVDMQIFGRDGDREYGINFMMDLLEEFNFKGTFFVDILMEHQFGREDLERTIEAIVTRGHDLQLHLHPSPNLLLAADRSLERFAPALTSDDRDLFRGALELAVELFVDRVGYRPVAYRSGAYHICDEFLSVLPEFDIAIDSSVYIFKNCRASEWTRTRTEPFWIGDVLEVPVSWMLRHRQSGEAHRYGHEQLAPAVGGVQQDAFASHRPTGTGQVPATLVYLAHSFSFLSVNRARDPKANERWNERYRAHVTPAAFDRIHMGRDVEWIEFDFPPDTNRIALLTRLLHGLAARTDVVPQTFRQLHEGGLDRFGTERELALDTVPVWDDDRRRASTMPMQVYTRGLLAAMQARESAA